MKVLAADISDGGSDLTVVAVRVEAYIMPLEYKRGGSLMAKTGWIADLIRRHQPDYVVVDAVGVGAGVYARLKEQGFNVFPFKAGNKVPSSLRAEDGVTVYGNLAAATWGKCREQLDPYRRDSLPLMLPPDSRLIGDLVTPKRRMDSRSWVWLEPKDEIRKRINRSTDSADAVTMTYFVPSVYRPVQVKKIEVHLGRRP